MPKTSCSPAAARKSTAAWNTPPSTMLTLCWIRGPESSRLPAVDPLVEARAGGLLDLPGGHHLDGVDRDEVVLVPVGAEALEEAALHDVVGPVAALARQRLDLDALERLDDLVGGRPLAARGPGGLLHRRPVGRQCEVGVVRFVVRPLLEPLLVPADEFRSEERRVGKGVDLGGRRIIKKKKKQRKKQGCRAQHSEIDDTAVL